MARELTVRAEARVKILIAVICGVYLQAQLNEVWKAEERRAAAV